MSARSFPMQASWPSAVAGGGPIGASVQHMIMLSRFFPTTGPDWTEALAAETRRHMAACLTMVERELRARLASGPAHGALGVLEGPLVWSSVQAQPQILSAALVTHMRLRAAVSLLARQALRAGGDPAASVEESSGWLAEDADPRVSGAATWLAQAESLWSDDMAMRADLPAEHYAELCWTAAALLGDPLSSMASNPDRMLAAVSAAAIALLAAHREEEGGLARAAILARLLRGRDNRTQLIGQVIGERRMLLFAALVADALDLDIEAVLETLVDVPIERLVALCRSVEVSGEDFRHLLIDLKIVRADMDDAQLLDHADGYDAMTPRKADALLAVLRQPQALRAKLALISVAVP